MICVAVSGAGAWTSQPFRLGCMWYLLTAYSVSTVFGAETPLGRPLALSVVAELNPPVLVMAIVLVPLLPCVTVSEEGDAAMVKFGDDAAFTVSETVVVAVKVPDVPVMVTVAFPVVAVLLAVRVSVLLEVVGFVLKAAVTPLGKPDAARVTLPENPP